MKAALRIRRASVKFIFALVAASCTSGCVKPAAPIPPNDAEAPRWTFTTEASPKGVFLVVHGLNLRPSALDPLCGFLASQGYHSYRMTLKGHNEPSGEIFDGAEWLRDVEAAYALSHERFPKLPVYALGYSIGGLLLTTMVEENPESLRPKGMILLAPAISLRTFFDVAGGLGLPPSTSWSVPNVAPAAYRRYELTPIFWYSNTLELYSKMQRSTNASHLKSVPTLIVLNPDDELVSESGVERFVSKNAISPEWRIALVHPEPVEKGLKEHLIIDSTSLGQQEWRRLKTLIANFLSGI